MTLTDLRVLCAALGFTAVVIKDRKLPKKEAALRATAFGGLIETFCRVSVPEAFADAGNNGPAADPETTEPKPDPAKAGDTFAVAERMATAIVEIIREQGGCLPHDLAARGFTYDEIDRHWAMAKALAYAGVSNSSPLDNEETRFQKA
jgi:hypothetical protein